MAPTIVCVEGDLDGRSLTDLIDALVEGMLVNHADLVVDLSQVGRISDLAIGVLERTWWFMRYSERSLIVRDPTPPVRALIDQRGLASLIEGATSGYGAWCARTDA
jgi:anti-anti-sigma regulatory factor